MKTKKMFFSFKHFLNKMINGSKNQPCNVVSIAYLSYAYNKYGAIQKVN